MEKEFEKIMLLSGAKIGIRPWRMKQKKEFLLALGDNEKANLKNAISNLLNYCLEKPELLENKISLPDYYNILCELKKRSDGNTIEVKGTCPYCNYTHDEYVLDLDTNVIKKSLSPNEAKIPVNDNLIFYIKDISMTDYDEIKSKNLSGIEEIYEMLCYSILSIEEDGVIKNNLSHDEKINYLDNLFKHEFEKLYLTYEKVKSKFDLDIIVTCANPECKKDMHLVFEDLDHFFVMS